jgi:predicted nucleotidyltransferase
MRQSLDAALSTDERLVLDRFVSSLEVDLADELGAVWLFGSRARGDRERAEDSDIDVLVIAADASWDAKLRIHALLEASARELQLEGTAWSFSIHVQTAEWLAQRREIRSFFIAEVDRDKIVLAGEA